MKEIKKLAGQTFIYGLSSILPRFLNWLLVSLYTYKFTTSEYGIVTELYAYVTFFIVILTYGLETGFFRFSNNSNYNSEEVYSNSFLSIFSTSLLFIGLIILFNKNVSGFIGYANYPQYILWFGFILAIDAICAIPFAYLRQKQKPFLFALYKILNVIINIGFNLFFIVFIPKYINYENYTILKYIYSPDIGIGYIFISNLIASIFTLLFLLPIIFKVKFKINRVLLLKLYKYSIPLLIAGLAGTINETLDRILIKHLIADQDSALHVLGIYGANYKLAIIMVLFIQAFRYAAEPFFFKYYKNDDSKELYANVMKYFVIFCFLIFLSVVYYIDGIKFIIGSSFREGIHIVPIILFAYILYGIFFNLSIWYKLKNVTKYGAILTLCGSAVTIFVNVMFVPKFGYYASAWGHFFSYFVMVIISYFMGRKFYPIKYPVKEILIYLILCLVLFFVDYFIHIGNMYLSFTFKTLLLVSFLSYILYKENLIKKFVIHEN